MKKILFMFTLCLLFFSAISINANAVTFDTNDVRYKMTRGTTYTGSGFKSGIITNHYEVEVTDSSIDIYEDVVLAYLSGSQDPYGYTSLNFNMKKAALKTHYAAFVDTMNDGYIYTVENALGLSTSGDSSSTSTNSIWCTAPSIGSYYTPSLITSSSTITYSVDGTLQDKEAIIAIVGDILAVSVECRQVQELWTGNSTVWTKETTLYVFLNAVQQVVYLDAA